MLNLFEGFTRPPSAAMMGWTLLEMDIEQRRIRIGFTATEAFLNPVGYVQGGMLAAMLDDTMGPAAIMMERGAKLVSTIDMNVSFIAPAKPGALFAEGRVIQHGKTISFVEAELRDEAGTLLARATSSVRMIDIQKVQR